VRHGNNTTTLGRSGVGQREKQPLFNGAVRNWVKAPSPVRHVEMTGLPLILNRFKGWFCNFDETLTFITSLFSSQ